MVSLLATTLAGWALGGAWGVVEDDDEPWTGIAIAILVLGVVITLTWGAVSLVRAGAIGRDSVIYAAVERLSDIAGRVVDTLLDLLRPILDLLPGVAL